jgi:hypothetical protein
VAVGLDIEIATVAAIATAAVAIADEKSNVGQLTRAVGTVGVSGSVWKSTKVSAMTRPCWLRRAVRNLHRYAIEQA